jgi:hypothetical protein
MTSNLVQFPRPLHKPPTPAPLAFFVHVGRNDHRYCGAFSASGGASGKVCEEAETGQPIPAGHGAFGGGPTNGLCRSDPATARHSRVIRSKKGSPMFAKETGP